MHTRTIRSFVRMSMVGAALFAAWPATWASAQVPIDRAAALQVFTERVEGYVSLRTQIEEPLPLLEDGHSSRSLLLRRVYLASAIRSARARARLGDIFTPAVEEMFRAEIAWGLRDLDAEGLATCEQDMPVRLAVNEPLPAWSLAEIPLPLRSRLPQLPPDVEYRVVDRALVLWDVRAEIVIDALPVAFTAR